MQQSACCTRNMLDSQPPLCRRHFWDFGCWTQLEGSLKAIGAKCVPIVELIPSELEAANSMTV